jgi:hypothetical protein
MESLVIGAVVGVLSGGTVVGLCTLKLKSFLSEMLDKVQQVASMEGKVAFFNVVKDVGQAVAEKAEERAFKQTVQSLNTRINLFEYRKTNYITYIGIFAAVGTTLIAFGGAQVASIIAKKLSLKKENEVVVQWSAAILAGAIVPPFVYAKYNVSSQDAKELVTALLSDKFIY